MRLFRRAAQLVNTHHEVASDAALALDPAARRVRKLAERGTPANGIVSGIRFSLSDGSTRKDFAVTVPTEEGALRFGVRTQPTLAHRLRLGVPVVVRIDGARGILDWSTMAAAWGLSDQFLTQESLRTPPADGIVDTSVDGRVQRRLARWMPVRATVMSLQRRTMLGMQTMTWDITLRLDDGRTAVSKADEVPSYAQWFAAPGAVVPAVVDPKTSSEAHVDWAAFATSRANEVGFDDDPPQGSIAAELETGAGVTPVMASTPSRVRTVSSAERTVALDATMRSWVDARRGGFLDEADFARAIDNWLAAGMCTTEQATAARRAATDM